MKKGKLELARGVGCFCGLAPHTCSRDSAPTSFTYAGKCEHSGCTAQGRRVPSLCRKEACTRKSASDVVRPIWTNPASKNRALLSHT